jgi:hypothetical protein
MITPASIGDWAMFAGMLASTGLLAAFGYRGIVGEEGPTEAPASSRSVPFVVATRGRTVVPR